MIQNLNTEDQLLVLEWRNQPEIRKWMKNSDPISLEEHFGYIEQLKEDTSREAYLVYLKQEPLGVINVDQRVNKDNPGIGLYTHPYKMHKGSGIKLAYHGAHFLFGTKGYNTLLFQANPLHQEVLRLWAVLGVKSHAQDSGKEEWVNGILDNQPFKVGPKRIAHFSKSVLN